MAGTNISPHVAVALLSALRQALPVLKDNAEVLVRSYTIGLFDWDADDATFPAADKFDDDDGYAVACAAWDAWKAARDAIAMAEGG
jgi:hypothetical protein